MNRKKKMNRKKFKSLNIWGGEIIRDFSEEN